MTSTGCESVQDDFRCKFIVPRKQRRCRQQVKAGHDYCGAHLPVTTAGQESTTTYAERRVQCPYGKHTVPAHQLARHVKICSDKKESDRWTDKPLHVPSINAGTGPVIEFPDAPVDLADFRGRVDTPACRRLAYALSLGPDALSDLISRLDTVYKRIIEQVPDKFSILRENYVEKLAENAGLAKMPFNLKHGAQHASIIGNMDDFGLCKYPKETTFIEFGAGKGYLTNALAEMVPKANTLIMMDNQKFTLLADRRLRDRKMQRLRCDIANFEPCGVQGFDEMPYWVAYGKHLCGAATDLTLRCAHRYLIRDNIKKNNNNNKSCAAQDGGGGEATDSEATNTNINTNINTNTNTKTNTDKLMSTLLGLGVATCCHHRCCWQHYIAQDLILELGFTAEEFEILSYTTSWALCGHGAANSSTSRKRKGGKKCESDGGSGSDGDGGGDIDDDIDGGKQGEKKEEKIEEDEEKMLEEEEEEEDTGYCGWRLHHKFSREERTNIGKQSKRLIDYGRVEWLRRNGFDAQEVLYCDSESSGENRLVLAKPRSV